MTTDYRVDEEPEYRVKPDVEYRVEPIMQFFGYDHLPEKLQAVSRPFCELAKAITDQASPSSLPRNAERSVALRKLLEAKDAAVRAAISR